MKVTQQSEPKFVPVVITLETQDELDILTCVVGNVAGVGKHRDALDAMYKSLLPLREGKDLVEGVLRIKT